MRNYLFFFFGLFIFGQLNAFANPNMCTSKVKITLYGSERTFGAGFNDFKDKDVVDAAKRVAAHFGCELKKIEFSNSASIGRLTEKKVRTDLESFDHIIYLETSLGCDEGCDPMTYANETIQVIDSTIHERLWIVDFQKAKTPKRQLAKWRHWFAKLMQ